MADIFPAGDPRNALYNETLAGLGLAFEGELSGIKEDLAKTESESAYQEGEQTRQEPGVFRGITNRANRGGLLTSGINARRKGDQTADFAARRVQRQNSLKEAREGAARRTDQAQKKYAQQQAQATVTAGSEAYQNIVNNPQPTAASPAGQSQGAAEHPGQWIGNVRIGQPAPKVQWSRDPKVRAKQQDEINKGWLSS